eukprot:253977_1
MSLVLSIIVWYTSTFEPSSANFNCISRQSVTSGTTDGAQINVNCTSSPYLTLVSCGTRTHDPTTSITDGSWIVGDSCFAQNGERGSTGQGVYAVARCCDFTHVPDLSCVALMSAFATGNDGKSSITCGSSTHQFLTGCTVRSPYTTIDGSYPGTINPYTQTRTADSDYSLNGYCTAVNGQTGDGTKGNLMCCASPSNALQCVIRYGSQSDGDKDSRATCGSGYAMTSCSGYGAWLSLNAWYISGDTCIARTYSASQYVYAIAICCKLETDSPTLDPTQSPTLNPTANPSANPSQSPTANPSSIPTKLITSNPTEAPSGNPTKTPTDNPTISPTSYPTSDPTTSPTDNPTISPTSDPTKSPIRNPSANPSSANPSRSLPSSVPPTTEPSTTSTDSPPSTLEPTLSPTDPCDVLSAVDFDDPCSPDPGTGCGVLIKLDATVCVINGLVTRSRLERSIVRSVKTIVNGLDELDVVCTEDKIYLKDVQVEPSREADADVARANGSHKPENESECPKVDELCGDEQNDEPQFDVDIVVAIRCDLSCDRLKDVAVRL